MVRVAAGLTPRSSSIRGLSASEWFGALLVLMQLTALYGFIGMAAHLPNAATLSIVTICLYLAYAVWNIRTVVSLLRKWYIITLVVFVWILPLFIMVLQFSLGVYSADRFIYWSAYTSFFGLLFVVSLVFAYNAQTKYVARLLLCALVVITFEFGLNQLSYQNVRPVLLFIGSPISASLNYPRILGFFGHPNEAACAINLCLFSLLFLRDVRFGIGQIVLIALVAGLIIMTGSRTSLFVLVLIVCGYLYHTLFTERDGGAKVLFAMAVGLPILMLAVAFFMAQPSTHDGMSQRVLQLVGMAGGANGGNDESASLRLAVLGKFIDIVAEAPIVGSGFDMLDLYVKQGVILNVSQIAWLQWAGEYGILYPVFGAFVFTKIYWLAWKIQRGPHRRGVRIAGSTLAFLMLILFIYSMSLVDIFMVRSIVVITGLTVGTMARAVRMTRNATSAPPGNKRGAV